MVISRYKQFKYLIEYNFILTRAVTVCVCVHLSLAIHIVILFDEFNIYVIFNTIKFIK